MMNFAKQIIKKMFDLIGLTITRKSKIPKDVFLSYYNQRHTQRRLEHLSSLGLEIAGLTVLEVGGGIGDHTSFFIDRSCQIVSSDARDENIKISRSRYPDIRVMYIDLDTPPETFNELFDIVYCYGVLYHLKNPTKAIAFISRCCQKMLFLETCVSLGDEDSLNPCIEDAFFPSQAKSGIGCRPTRRWVYNQLKRYFNFVYLPITQPNHEEFPLDWTSSPPKEITTRAVFVASRQKIINKLLVEEIPLKQIRH